MAIAFQASSESANVASVASFPIPNHPLTSTSEGLAVFVYGFGNATDIITSVTVGGINVPLIGTAAASFAADTVTEFGFVEVYFLSGSTLPRVTSTITINRTNNATTTYANAISITAAALPVQIVGLTELNENQTVATITINDGGEVGSSLRMMGLYTGAAAAPAATAATTVSSAGLNTVVGAAAAGTYYELAAGSGSRSIGIASTTDDTALIAFAIAEPDQTPTYPNLSANTTGVGHNNQYFASFAATAPILGGGTTLGGGTVVGYTVAGLSAGATVTASVTAGNATFAVNSVFATYVTTATVTNGDVIYCQFLTPNTVSTAETYTLQIGTVSRSVTLTTGAILPDRLVDLTVTPYYSVLPFAQTSASVVVSGATNGHEYTIGSGSGFITVLATPVAASGTSATITIPNANLPTGAGAWVNRLYVRVPVAAGGNNIWSPSSPMGIGTINGGTSGNLEWSWSRATTATTLGVGTVTESITELTGGQVANVSIGWTPVANQVYQILRGDLNPDVIVVTETATSPASLLNADANDLPVAGKTAQYSIQVKRSIANGGDDLWYTTTGTNQPFEINRIGAPTVDDTQDFDTTGTGSTFAHAVGLKIEGSGGTLQYNVTTTTTPPTTGWQTYPTNSFTLTRSTAYYFWARRSTTDATDRDISAQQTTPEPAFYGLRVYSADGAKIVFDTSSLPLNLITCKLLAGGVTFSQSINAGATSSAIYVDGMTTTNGSSIFIVVRGPQTLTSNAAYTVTRQAGYFTITNNTTSNATFYYFAGRYK
jgi:hypothetical protein